MLGPRGLGTRLDLKEAVIRRYKAATESTLKKQRSIRSPVSSLVDPFVRNITSPRHPKCPAVPYQTAEWLFSAGKASWNVPIRGQTTASFCLGKFLMRREGFWEYRAA